MQVEACTFDGDALGCPLFLESGEAFTLPDGDHMLFKVELLGIEAQQAEPQLPYCLTVLLELGPAPLLRNTHTHTHLAGRYLLQTRLHIYRCFQKLNFPCFHMDRRKHTLFCEWTEIFLKTLFMWTERFKKKKKKFC